jgi:hypothetical protein
MITNTVLIKTQNYYKYLNILKFRIKCILRQIPYKVKIQRSKFILNNIKFNIPKFTNIYNFYLYILNKLIELKKGIPYLKYCEKLYNKKIKNIYITYTKVCMITYHR